MKKEQTATASIVIDKTRPGKDGTFPVKLRVIYERKYRDYVMKYPTANEKNSDTLNRLVKDFQDKAGATIRLSEEDFTKARGTKPREIYSSYKTMFQTYEETARNIIAKLPGFTFDRFTEKYFSTKDKSDVYGHFEATIKKLRLENRISTAISYECTMRSLKAFTNDKKLTFDMITVSFLKDYEKWMQTPRATGNRKTVKQNSPTTTGIYLRTLRAIFNSAKPENIPYPFGFDKHGLYQIPTGENTKKALKQSDIAEIAAYNCAGKYEARSRDLWLFSYLANGINIKDIARLKYSNIVQGEDGLKIVFTRAKTARTRKKQKFIDVPITKPIGKILDRWGNKPAEPNQYIFPILTAEMTAEMEYKAIQQTIQTTNKYMKLICAELKKPPVTTYAARHSFATVLKRAGVSTEFISESLGHTDLKTTENYLSSFEDKKKREIAEKLLPELENQSPEQ